MINHIEQSPLHVPEYTGASVILHAGCLALLFLNLHYYSNKPEQLPAQKEQPQQAPKKEPRIIMKRVPVTPTPNIAQEQEAQTITEIITQPQEPAPAKTESTSSLSLTMKVDQEIKKSQTPEQHTITVQKKIIQKIQQAQTVKRSKMQHSWYAHQKTAAATQEITHTNTQETQAVTIHEMALSHIFQKPQSRLSQAQQAAENFKRDFQEAAVNDYISAIHHAIAFSLNRMRIMLSPREIPPQIIMKLTITERGAITYTHVSIIGHDNPSLTNSIKRAIVHAAPFRPFPPSITTAELNLTINAYPDSSYVDAAHHSSQPTPLLFTLGNNRISGL